MTESPPPAEAFRPPSFILNVNDDEASRYLTSRILGQAGYTVREAVDGTGALTMAMDGPSLIVLDVKLPDMTGLEVCRILKADPRTTHIPILQTSATYVSAERKVAGLEAGADAYLAQPIEPPELIANVRALLRARLAEEALYEAGREWQQTFDALQDAVAVIGPSGKPLRLNPTMREVLAGEPVEGGREALDRFLGRQLDAAVDEVRGTGSRTTLTTRHGEREYRVVIDPVGAQTTVHRMILVASDITLEKRLAAESQERAREFEEEARRKDEFLAMLAHELRNPLHAISAAVQLQQRMGDRLERRAELHQAISLQVKNLARLVDDLMDVSRVTRGKISLRIEELDVNEVVRRAIQTVSMPERITAALTAQPTRTMADSLRLEQIVGNLLGNASKYSPPDSPIRVSTRLTGSRVQVVVEDEGCGIEADELQSIFETFVQVEQPLDRARGGLGIGLTIARSLAELHGGRLWAESEGVGRGARFLLELPLQRLRERGPTEGMTTQAEGLRIVLLEDNLVASEAIVALLEELGHAAVAVHDGVEGLKALLQERPDVALVDIGLPGMDGFEVARRLRAETQDVHLVAVTGYGQPKDRARAEASGFDDFLVKPVDLPTLEGVLARRKRAS